MERRPPRTIAVDGPGASGKSVVGRRLAQRLGYLYFDTGALYRALAVLALEAGVAADDEAGLVALLEAQELAVASAAGPVGYRVMVSGRDVTGLLRSTAVDAVVSPMSSHPGVRALLLERQRQIAREQAVVMTGRDIGTVVLPDAQLKFYLDAPLLVRARRRFRERLAAGVATTFAAELDSLERRDAQDRGREHAPLAIAPDAIVVDTQACTVDQVVAHLLGLVELWPEVLARAGHAVPCRA